MANYSAKDVIFTVGGTDMTAHLRKIGDIDISAITQKSTPFGSTGVWIKKLSTGIKEMQPLTLGGFYEDTAVTGPDAKFGVAQLGTTVACVLTYGGTKTTTFSAIIHRYKRSLQEEQSHEYEVELEPTGTVTEA